MRSGSGLPVVLEARKVYTPIHRRSVMEGIQKTAL